MNIVTIVGRLTKDPEVINTADETTKVKVVVAVSRSYKDVDGNYPTDYIDCILTNNYAKTTIEYVHKGDLIGVKGFIATEVIEETGELKKVMYVTGEKVTFLTKSND